MGGTQFQRTKEDQAAIMRAKQAVGKFIKPCALPLESTYPKKVSLLVKVELCFQSNIG